MLSDYDEPSTVPSEAYRQIRDSLGPAPSKVQCQKGQTDGCDDDVLRARRGGHLGTSQESQKAAVPETGHEGLAA